MRHSVTLCRQVAAGCILGSELGGAGQGVLQVRRRGLNLMCKLICEQCSAVLALVAADVGVAGP